MYRLIDIAGRTGHAPVRSLLSHAGGTSNAPALLKHEIRYRNDQHRVLFGLYRCETIVGLVGLARRPGDGFVEILHFAIADGETSAGAGRVLLEMVVERETQTRLVWRVPKSFKHVAAELGFRSSKAVSDGQPWHRPRS